MTEEEKKAICELKNYISRRKLKYTKLDRHDKSIDNLLNLLEKLQKENEELKNKIMEKELEIIGKEEYTKASMGEIIEQYYTANEECIPIQKAKAKIEELDIEISTCEYADDDSEEYKQEVEKDKAELLMAKKVLQQLLEESEE